MINLFALVFGPFYTVLNFLFFFFIRSGIVVSTSSVECMGTTRCCTPSSEPTLSYSRLEYHQTNKSASSLFRRNINLSTMLNVYRTGTVHLLRIRVFPYVNFFYLSSKICNFRVKELYFSCAFASTE
jgi:hypothetical protein